MISNVRVAGELRIQADNVRISNLYVESQGYYGNVAKWSGSGNSWSGNHWYDGRHAGRIVGP